MVSFTGGGGGGGGGGICSHGIIGVLSKVLQQNFGLAEGGGRISREGVLSGTYGTCSCPTLMRVQDYTIASVNSL